MALNLKRTSATSEKKFIAGCLVILALFGELCWMSNQLVVNFSASIPTGVYRPVADTNYAKGDIVAVCLGKSEQSRLAKQHTNLTSGSCKERYGRMIKIIRATAGDIVDFADDGLYVNGERIPDSKPLSHDKHGNPLPKIRGVRVVQSGDYLLMGQHPKSLDSRYLGFFNASQLQYKVKPVWLF